MRYLLTISYDGTLYAGWQVQPGGRTIQGEIERALEILLKKDTRVHGSGRTDAGVHAFAQTAHFDVERKVEDIRRFKHSMNGILSRDIRILSVKEVPSSFHARKSAKKKTYLYFLSDTEVFSPLLKGRVYFCLKSLDLTKIQEAAKCILGTHDFASFQASDCSAKTTERTIYELNVRRKVLLEHEIVELAFTGNGFLKHMVRNIVGTLICVGQGRWDYNKFVEILKSRDRINAGPTVPAWGLYLKEVFYE